MSIFSYESKFSQIVFRISYACFLNLLWFVCSLPIVTLGASTAALYSVTLKIAEKREGNIRKQFFAAFKENFKQATIVWLILLALGLLIAADIYVLMRLRNSSTGAPAIAWTLLLAVAILFVVIFTIEFIWVFPLIARVENTTRAMMVNSLLIGLRYLFSTIIVFAIHFAMAVVVIRFFTPAIVFGEGLCALLSSYFISPVIRACTTPAADDAPDGAADEGAEEDERP